MVVFLRDAVGSAIKSGQQPIDPPPNWKSKNVKYWILKKEENYKIAYDIDDEKGEYYVGNSTTQLEQFVGKQVRIQGDFPKTWYENEAKQQCIMGKCHDIFHPKFWEAQDQRTTVINITSVEEVK